MSRLLLAGLLAAVLAACAPRLRDGEDGMDPRTAAAVGAILRAQQPSSH